MTDEMVIAGAGIGGLCPALSLQKAGLPVHVFESVPELKPLGAGINPSPHAVRELDELGLVPALDAAGVRCRELTYCSKRGERIWSEPRGLPAGYRWPQISIHRGTLQQLLLDAARERLGADRLQFGHHLTRFEANAHGVSAWVVDERRGPELATVEGSLLIDRRRRNPLGGAPDCFAHLHDVVSANELQAITDKHERIAGFAIAELDERPSVAQPTA